MATDKPATADTRHVPTVSAVSIDCQLFWPVDPEVWLAQVEAQFTTGGVTAQNARFEYVVSSLGPEFAMEVRDLILKPPADNSYDTLKAKVIKCTAASKQPQVATPQQRRAQ